jgi:hypothetical protein
MYSLTPLDYRAYDCPIGGNYQMAKKQTTKEEMTETPATAKKLKPVGVYLRKNVRAEVEKIAEAEGLPVHAVLAYGVSYFVRQYKAGKVNIETVKTTTLNLDV